MAQFDPAMRRETWVFQEIGRDARGPVWVLADYLYVSYDDSPQRYLEPWPNGEIMVTDGPNAFKLLDPTNRTANSSDAIQGVGRVVGFEFVTSRPFEVHSFNDIDCTNLGQLPKADTHAPVPALAGVGLDT